MASAEAAAGTPAILEPVLAVPPKLTATTFALLKGAGLVAQRWNVEGRYGSRTGKLSDDRRTLPCLEAAAARISAFLRNVGGECEGDGEGEVDGEGESKSKSKSEGGCTPLPAALIKVLETEGVELLRVVPTPARVPRDETLGGEVHPERKPTSPLTGRHPPAPPPGSFTYAELFAGIGGFALGEFVPGAASARAGTHTGTNQTK